MASYEATPVGASTSSLHRPSRYDTVASEMTSVCPSVTRGAGVKLEASASQGGLVLAAVSRGRARADAVHLPTMVPTS